MKKAVIYARYSSDKQTEQSIEGQMTVCYEYAKKNDIMVVGEYIDRAMTGMNDDRPEFQRMLKDSNKRIWDYVLVYKLDRFSRNRYDSAIHNKTLKKNNAKLISASENISDSPEGVLMESLLTGMSEYYSLELSQKINRGLNENIRKGLMVGGSVTWGYDMLNKKLIINDETSEYIRLIFRLYREGSNIDEIITILNDKGILNANGMPFSHQHISKILHNKRYIGIFTYKGVEYPNYIPPIIELDTWHDVQSRLVNYKNYGRKKSPVTFYLTGKLTCGYCGQTMRGISGTSSHIDRKHYYYQCKNKDKLNERKTDIEQLIVSAVMQTILKVSYLDELVDFIVDSGNKIELNAYNEIERLQRTIASNKKKVANLLIAVRSGVISQSLQEDLIRLEQHNERLTLEIAKRKLDKSMNFDRDKVLYFFHKLSKMRTSDERLIEFVLKTFVKRVTVWDDDNITIELQIGNERNTLNRADFTPSKVRIGATQFHQPTTNTNYIGFKKPTMYVFGGSIYILIHRVTMLKKKPNP
jgi:site-specific DNA recombinase